MKVLFRTDASPEIGTGHFMRCLALAKTLLKDGNEVTFISKDLPEACLHRLFEAQCDFIDLGAGDVTAYVDDVHWIVVDGYTFDSSLQDALTETETKVLWIDDFGHCDHYSANLILNQNVYATDAYYKQRSPETKLLLGTRYALLREEFFEDFDRTTKEHAENILVTLGGGDPDNVTEKVIAALKDIDANIKVVIGGANPHKTSIEAACTEAGMELIVDSTEMRSLMEWADLAIAAGGTTSYELARMGLPVISIILADNQKAVSEGMEREGVFQNLGWHEDIDAKVISDAVSALRSDETLFH